MKAELKDIQSDMDFASDRISAQVRLASASLLAVTWGLVIGDPAALAPVTQRYLVLILAIGGLAMVALACDFLQYVFAYLSSRQLHRRLTAQGLDEGEYDYGALRWRVRYWMFWAKQAILGASILLFLLLVGLCIWR